MIEYKSVVLKFGGSVLRDKYAMYRAANLVKTLSEYHEIKAIVVSAMGKTTDMLDKSAHSIVSTPNKCALDTYLSTGETQSAALFSMCLNNIGVFAHSYNVYQCGIITDNNYGNAKIKRIEMPYINPLNGIPVVPGFQGMDESGNITTLGREGSDISAVWFATVMVADFCWFFKDGGGIYNKNPNENPDARLFKELSYDEMLAILDNKEGKGQVLHSGSVTDAKRFGKLLFVSSMNDPLVGTIINQYAHAKFH